MNASLRSALIATGAAACLLSAARAAPNIDPAAPDRLRTFTEAVATFEPEGRPASVQPVKLEFRWSTLFPKQPGQATFRLELPAAHNTTPMALMFTRIGNQAVVSVNGVMLQRFGTLGNPDFDAAKTTRTVVVPAALLNGDRPNLLEIRISAQAQRGAGLSSVLYGSETAIDARAYREYLTHDVASLVYAASLALTGAFAAALWWRQRDALYGVFSLSSFAGVARNLDHALPEAPLPWPLWGAVLAICYACHLALIARFTLLAAHRNPPWLVRTIYAVMLASSLLGAVSLMSLQPLPWTVGLGLLGVMGLACLVLIVDATWRRRARTAWVMLVAGTLTLLCGTHDFIVVRVNLTGSDAQPLMPHALFVFVLILAGIVVERYSRTLADHRELNANLSRAVDERERQLNAAFDALRVQQQEQAVADERQRIMREIHDGVGSQLVGLLNLVSGREADPAQLEEHVKLALDEMRMAVDSLQPVHGDLGTVLATLRYRLQPRLQAAGIQVLWDVAPLPPLEHLSPQAVWQVQRILMEAFTNVLKHARATQVKVQARWTGVTGPSTVSLALCDNGVGLPTAAESSVPCGNGLPNMRTRALAIGAALRIESAPGGGTRVVLELPMQRGPASTR